MKFKVDENLPSELSEDLKRAGHDSATVFDEGIAGVEDAKLLSVARQESRILLTLDKGIANIVTYPRGTHAGVVLFRPDSLGRIAVLEFVRARLTDALQSDLEDRITVVTSKRIRSR